MLKVKGYKAPSGTQYWVAARPGLISENSEPVGLDVTAYLQEGQGWPIGNDTFITWDEVDKFLLAVALEAELVSGQPNVVTQAVTNQRRNKKGAGVLKAVAQFVADAGVIEN